MNSNGTNRRAEESQQFPRLLGEHGEEQKANRVLAAASSFFGRDRRRDEAEGALQVAGWFSVVENEARKEGIWIENPASLMSQQISYGQENTVYVSKDNRSVIKFYNLKVINSNQDIEVFIDRINAHNQFAENVPYTVLGFAKEPSGEVGILLQQPYVHGTMEADQYTIDTYLQKAGYSKQLLSNGRRGWANETFEIWDAVPRNVLMDVHGDLYFIDININSK